MHAHIVKGLLQMSRVDHHLLKFHLGTVVLCIDLPINECIALPNVFILVEVFIFLFLESLEQRLRFFFLVNNKQVGVV